MFTCDKSTSARIHKMRSAMEKRCKACTLGQENTSITPVASRGIGKIMIVGKEPLEYEHNSSEGFMTPLGRMLEKVLYKYTQLNLDRDCYATYLLKCAPGNDTVKIDDKRTCVSHHLMAEIKMVQPKLIVFLSKTVATIVLGKGNVPKQGDIKKVNFKGASHYVVVVRNPDSLLFSTGDSTSQLIATQFSKIQWWLKVNTEEFTKELTPRAAFVGKMQKRYNNRKYILVNTVDKFKAMAKDILSHDWVAIDTETTGLDPWRKNFSHVGFVFAVREDVGYYVPTNHKNTTNKFTGDSDFRLMDFEKVIWLLKKLKGFKYNKVCHNVQYDHMVLSRYGIYYNKVDYENGKIEIHDTMIMQYLLNENIERIGLKPLTATYFGILPDDFKTAAGSGTDIARAFQSQEPIKVVKYTGDDGCGTLMLKNYLWPKLVEYSNLHTDGKLHNKVYLTEVISSMIMGEATMRGIRVDVEYYKNLLAVIKEDIYIVEKKLINICNVIDFTSNDQLIKLIKFLVTDKDVLAAFIDKYDGLDAQKSTLESFMSFYRVTYEKALKNEKKEIGPWNPDKVDEYIKTGLLYKKLTKIHSTYLEKVKDRISIEHYVDEEGNKIPMFILHGNFGTIHTNTGRMASKNPNLQNIPRDGVKFPEECPKCGQAFDKKTGDGYVTNVIGSRYTCVSCKHTHNTYTYDLRKLFIHRLGKAITASDWSSMEILLIAAISGDPNLLDVVHYKVNDPEDVRGDLHTITAAKVNDVELDEFAKNLKSAVESVKKKFKAMRQDAKPVNFGAIYGITALGIMGQFRMNNKFITEEEAQSYLDAFFDLFPGVERTAEETKHLIRTTGRVSNVYGRLRHGKKDADESTLRSINNFRIQGLGASILKEVLLRIDPILKEVGAQVLLCIHDEIIVESKPEHAKWIAFLLKYYMEVTVRGKEEVKLKTEPEYNLSSLSKDAECIELKEDEYNEMLAKYEFKKNWKEKNEQPEPEPALV